MRQLQNRLSSSEYQMGIPERRPRDRLSIGVKPMFEIGDCVVFSLDRARGIIMEANDDVYHVVWEDFFSSWEKGELLSKIALRLDDDQGADRNRE